jgi:uncharacterized protein YjbI with pentapeptide repeats
VGGDKKTSRKTHPAVFEGADLRGASLIHADLSARTYLTRGCKARISGTWICARPAYSARICETRCSGARICNAPL